MQVEISDSPQSQSRMKQTSKNQNLIQYSLPRGDNDEIQISVVEIKNENNNSSMLSNSINPFCQSAQMCEFELEFQNHKSEKRLEQNKQNDGTTFTFVQAPNLSKSISQESDRPHYNNNNNQNNNNRSSLFKNIQSTNNYRIKTQNTPSINLKDDFLKTQIEEQTDNNSQLLQSLNLPQEDKKIDEGAFFCSQTTQRQDIQNKTSTFILPYEKSLICSSNKSVLIKVNQENSLSEQINDSSIVQNSKQQEHKKQDSSAFKSQKTTFASTNQVHINNIYSKSFQEQNIGKRIEGHIKKFLFLLKNSIGNRSSENLTQQQRKLINDFTDFTDSFSYGKYNIYLIDKSLQIISKFINNTSIKFIVMPTGTFKVIWDTLQIIFNFIFLYAYSIFLIFAETEKEIYLLNFFFHLFIFLLFCDIIINFNSSYYQKDQIITKRTMIFTHYLKSFFFWDFLCFLSSIYISTNSTYSVVYNADHNIEGYIIHCLTYSRIFGIYSKRRVFNNIQQLSSSQRHLIKLINQLLFMISIAHIMGILWYLLGLYQQLHGIEVVWIAKYNGDNIFWFSKYILSFYWAVTTMTTVGYGDITPSNSIECLFCALSMIVFSCVFAYSINNIGMILQEIEKSSRKMNDNIIIMQRWYQFNQNYLISISIRYLIRRNVNTSLRNRIKQYLHFLGQETKDKDKNAEEQVISILSNKLRDELTQEVNTKMLKTCSIFYKLFSQSTLQKIVRFMKEIQVYPNEIIYNVGEIGNQALYFVLDGEIEIFCEHEKRKTVFGTYKSNQYFGEYSFFSGFSRIFSARSLSLSTLFYLPREDFFNIIRTNSEDFQRYKMLQEQFCVNGITSGLNAQGCASCGSLQHFANECSQTHLVLDSQLIALKNNYFEFQLRNYKMERKRKKNSLSQPLKHVQSNKDYSKTLNDRISEIGGIFYDRIKMYSQEDYDSENQDENEKVLQDEEYSSESNSQSDEESLKSNYKSKDIKQQNTLIASNQLNENNQAVNIDPSKRKMSCKQEKSNKFTGNGTLQQPHFYDFANDSEIAKQTIKSSEYANNSDYYVQSLTGLEKRLAGEESYVSSNIIQQNDSLNEVKISPKSILKINEEIKRAVFPNQSQINLEYDPQTVQLIHHNSTNNEQQNENKLQKPLYLQKSVKGALLDSQIVEQDYKLKKTCKKSTKDIAHQTTLDQQNNFNSKDLCEYKELARLLSKQNCVSKRKIIDEEQKIEKMKKQSSYKNIIKMNTSKSVVDEIPKEYIEQKIKINADNFLPQQTMNSENKKKLIKSTQIAQLLKQSYEQSNILLNNEQNLVELIFDLLHKKSPLAQQKVLLSNSTGIEAFDKMQIFSKFFPHNNFDQIIQKNKQKKSQPRQTQKISQRVNNRRHNIFQQDFTSFQKEIQQINLTSISGQNYDSDQQIKTYKPTVISYGICTKTSQLYPKRMIQNIF